MSPSFPPGLWRAFIESTEAELGRDTLAAVLPLAGLSAEMPVTAAMQGETAAAAFADLQRALRSYYGRGARGLLHRIAARMWPLLLETGGLRVRARAGVTRNLPAALRRKAVLELLSELLGGGISVHTLDLDLLLVDAGNRITLGSGESGPICHLTTGLIAEALIWAGLPARSIEETACRADGAKACEYKILTGEK